MSEQDPLQKRIAQALKSSVEPAEDDGLYRDGQLYRFPTQMGTTLEVFPSHGRVRVGTPGRSAVELHHQGEPHIEEDCVVFEDSRQTLIVQSDGVAVWTWKPEPVGEASVDQQEASLLSGQRLAPEATADSGHAGSDSRPTSLPHRRETGLTADPVPFQQVADPPPPSTRPEARPEGPTEKPEAKEERVQLTGRLGRTPTFRTTPRGTFIGKFPLAVHLEDGEAKWHTILAFGKRAKKLEQKVAAGEVIIGREVDVIGYSHTREEQRKNGKPKTVKEVYAAVVKAR